MLQPGQVLSGRLASYKLTRQLADSVWVAIHADQQTGEEFIIKHVADIKPNNVLVNYSAIKDEITDVQLADLESCVREDSSYAKEGASIGTPIFRSTEAFLNMPWNTSTDVWSFGAMEGQQLSPSDSR